jgi:hypothetical protein
MRRILFAVGVMTAALLAVTALAVAGRAKINDPNENTIKDCQDGKVVKGKSTDDKTTFTITMYGKASAKPCKGDVEPSLSIDINNNDFFDPGECSVGKDPISGKVGVFCGGKKKGKADITADGKVWTISFKTSDLKNHKSKFGFIAHLFGPKAGDEMPDSGLKTIKVG